MEKTYTDREIDTMIKNVDEKLDLILNQTTEHNHRMTKIEETQIEWKGAIKVIIAIVLPLMAWVLWQQYTFKDEVRQVVEDSVESKLGDYNILYKANEQK